MKYRCDDCKEYHDTSDLTINIGDEGYKVIDDINEAVMVLLSSLYFHCEKKKYSCYYS